MTGSRPLARFSHLVLLSLGMALFAPGASDAESCCEYRPNRPINLIVGSPPGSIEYEIATLVAERLKLAWGQAVIVEPVAGANGIIAAAKVSRSAPDGRTWLVGSVNGVVLTTLFSSRPSYDPSKELLPITKIARMPLVLVVRPDNPAKNLFDLVALAKSRSGALTYGSPGVGSLPHLFGEQFKSTTGTNIVHVPFKGTAPAVQEVAAGSLDMAFVSSSVAVPLLKEGRLRALAMTGESAFSGVPGVPLFAAIGARDLRGEYWFGLFAPAGMDRKLAGAVSNDVRAVLNDQNLVTRMRQLGVEVQTSDPAKFSEFVRGENATWGAVAKKTSIRLD